jgi:hypothetical protein
VISVLTLVFVVFVVVESKHNVIGFAKRTQGPKCKYGNTFEPR